MQLLFIHGSGATSQVWRYQSAFFTDALTIDLPGRPEGECCTTIESATAWLKAYVDEHQLEDLVLIGHSLGTAIALQYALTYPTDPKALILIGGGARLRVHPDTLAFLEKATEDPDIFPQMFVDSWQNVPANFAKDLRSEALALGPAVFLNDMRSCDAFDVINRLGEISTPSLAITGTNDVMTPPKYATFLRDRMPNTETTFIEGGTHFVFGEYPDQVNAAIQGFLEKLG